MPNTAGIGQRLLRLPKPVAKYRPAVRHGNLLYLSGHGPVLPDGSLVRGRVGADLTT